MTARGAILLTGFTAFGDFAENPTAAIATALDGTEIGGLRVCARVLPVSRAGAEAALRAAIDEVAPALLLATGLTGGRSAPAAERIAVNVLDFPIPDTDGEQPASAPVVPGGPAGIFSTLPIKAILRAWRQAGLAGYISNSAGTYLCNQVFYLAAHIGAARGFPAGLIHLPFTPAQAMRHTPPAPSLALDAQCRAVQIAIEAARAHRGADLDYPAGAMS